MVNLVIQGSDIATPDLKALAKLAQASGIERISATAFRLCDARPAAEVAPYCARAMLDHAYVPAGRRLSDYGLAVMDMDSTLITIECIDEIADMQGIKPEVAAITAAAMRGEIDYAESLRQRVQLLAGMKVSAFERVYTERLALTAGAESMLRAMRAAGICTLLVSGGFSFFTTRLKARLGLDAACSNEPEVIDGCLTGRLLGDIVDGAGKANALTRMRDELGIARTQVIGIGDGANDLPFLAEAGVSIAFHAKPSVRAAATHCLDHVGLEGVIALFE
ncbi:MAG: phosphoserine phosphatase SerB [Betaproteobacteria bacterium]|nr:MAG: phosphoserine phosphatase SerB [Betaproteobacteria bacterium]